MTIVLSNYLVLYKTKNLCTIEAQISKGIQYTRMQTMFSVWFYSFGVKMPNRDLKSFAGMCQS